MIEGVAFLVLVAGSLLETVLYFFATPFLARFAFVPIGTHAIDVGPAGQELLSGRKAAALAAEGMPREAAGYRSAPLAPVAKAEGIVETLGFPFTEEQDSHIMYATPARNEIATRLPFKFFGSRTYGVVRTKLSFDGHKITVVNRFLPVPSLSYGLATVMFGIAAIAGSSEVGALFPVVLLVALAINGVISYFRLRGPLQMLRLRMESDIYALR